MMTKSCPKCGSEMPAGSTVCVNCGANADAKPDVDNSAEISRLFGKEDENIVVNSEELSAKDIAAFESGSAIEFSHGGTSAELSESAMESIAEMDGMKFENILPPESDASEFDDDNDGIILKHGVTEMHGYKMPGKLKQAILTVFVFLLAFSFGFGTHYFLSQGIYGGYTNSTAIEAVKFITEVEIPEDREFKAVEIYVKRGADRTECIVFGVIIAGANDYTQTYYHLVIDNKEPISSDSITRPFNQALHDELAGSSDAAKRMEAATMSGRHDSFLRTVAEINSGRANWQKADVEHVNRGLI
ncbi:MAG: hypothetical protein FWG70_04750 [Oscillospiraceae bacterium]|nr:hypothetical protein [Oscillospiraceae bacterium]